MHLGHSVVELTGEFANKSLQRTTPFRTDREVNHALLKGTEELSGLQVLALQVVDHDEQYERIPRSKSTSFR